jgi:AraC family transcriptional regulator
MARNAKTKWSAKAATGPSAKALAERIGAEIVRFQEASHAVDELAAAILGLERRDLPCMTQLLFGGPATARQLADALRTPLGAVRDVVAKLEMAGYARRRHTADGVHIELTAHAREWINRIWEPLARHGDEVAATFSNDELASIARFVQTGRELQEQHASDLRAWLAAPARTRQSHQRGGLSPAALRRVQLFVEANVERPLHTRDLAARAGLSVFHFARAFRVSTGVTPQAYLHQRRIELAKTLIGTTTQPLARIAVTAGFSTQSRLTTAFRRATGFTPATYRRGRATAGPAESSAAF